MPASFIATSATAKSVVPVKKAILATKMEKATIIGPKKPPIFNVVRARRN